MKKSISIERLNAQRASVNVRNITLEVGEELKFLSYNEDKADNGDYRDNVMYVSSKRGLLKFSLPEFNRLKTAEGLLTDVSDVAEFNFPTKLKVANASIRVNAAGERMYPVSAYKGAQSFYATLNLANDADGKVTINDLYATGLVENATPLHDYTVTEG